MAKNVSETFKSDPCPVESGASDTVSTRPSTNTMFLNLVLLAGTTREKLHAARAAGFDAVELWREDVEAVAGGADEVRRIAEAFDLGFLDYQVLRDFDGAPGEQREAKRAEALEMLETARRVGTRTLLVPASTDPECDVSRIGADMAWLVGEARKRDLRIAYEAMAWSTVNSDIRAAYATIHDLDPTICGLVLDSYHLFVRGGTSADLAEIDPRRIFLVQFADVIGPVAPADFMSAARHRRLLPGDGNLPIRSLVGYLRTNNYKGPVGLEVFNDELKQRSAASVSLSAYQSLAKLLALS